jgi:hypothetical protein
MPGNEVTPSAELGSKMRVLVAAGILALAVLPILVTPYPPATDLPQHLAQVRLFVEALKDPGGPYVINWAAPGNLIYIVIFIFRAILPSDWVARAVLILLVILWISTIHLLAAARGRPVAAAIVASLLVFNQSFYWGFINFLLGFPVFALWFVLTVKDPRSDNRDRCALLVLTSLLLYESHALWFAVGAAWLFMITAIRKPPLRTLLLQLAVLAPCGAVAALWYPSLAAARAAAGFDVAPHWLPFFERLGSLLSAAFGGIRGPAENLAFVYLYAWIALSIWRNRGRLKGLIDRDLLAVPALLSVILLFAPHMYMNTIFFASRWLPTAMIFLFLALPAPYPDRNPLRLVSLGTLAALFLATFFAWRGYRLVELDGFQESLDRLPASSRVLGLDLVKESDYIKGRPFLQLHAYAQIQKGCDLSFSFARHYSSLVALRDHANVTWTYGLDWHPERTKRTDFGFFDYVLVNGTEDGHKIVLSYSELSPVTRSGRWRLYRVLNKATAP